MAVVERFRQESIYEQSDQKSGRCRELAVSDCHFRDFVSTLLIYTDKMHTGLWWDHATVFSTFNWNHLAKICQRGLKERLRN